MKTINQLTGRIVDFSDYPWHLKDILPSAFEKQLSTSGYSEFLFFREKFAPGLPRRVNPDFVLDKYLTDDKILLVQPSFGHWDPELDLEPLASILGLIDYNIRVIISTDILIQDYYQVALQKGLLLVTVTENDFKTLQDNAENNIEIDLPNELIRLEDQTITFEVDPGAKDFLSQGQDLIDYTMQYKEALKRYEANYRTFDD